MTTLLEGLESELQRELARPAPPVAPGLAVTLWGGTLDVSLPLLAQVRPDIVLLHADPSGRAVPGIVAHLRVALPGVRVWLQAPGNVLARETPERACALAERWARIAVELGAEVLSINGEGSSAPGLGGWKPSTLTAEELSARARAVLEAATRPGLVLAWSSHDCPAWHHLPWEALYGRESPVRLALHQHYPARGDAVVGLREALARLRGSREQWAALARQGTVRPDLVPGAPGAVVYTQAHGLSTAAACALLDAGALAAAWAVPTRADPAGLLALRVDAELRRRAGHDPGRIARWQASAGLVAWSSQSLRSERSRSAARCFSTARRASSQTTTRTAPARLREGFGLQPGHQRGLTRYLSRMRRMDPSLYPALRAASFTVIRPWRHGGRPIAYAWCTQAPQVLPGRSSRRRCGPTEPHSLRRSSSS